MKKTLLELAMEKGELDKRKRYNSSDEEIDLAIALVEGKISFTQCSSALGLKSHGNSSHFLSKLLRNACIAGKIKIIKTK